MIHIPTTCPSCGEKLRSSELELFCINTELCPAQNSKRLENFSKVMKIKGLGAKSIEKLMDEGLLDSIPSIYKLSELDLTSVLGTANGQKLFAEIQNSKNQKLEIFLQALGIKMIAVSSAKAIAEEIQTLDNFTLENMSKPAIVKKLGQAKHAHLVEFLHSEMYENIMQIPLNLQSRVVDATVVTMGVVCITGSLQDFRNRKEAEDFLRSKGWEVKASVTKDVTHLVCEDEAKKGSSSYKKALDRGLPIVTIKQIS